MLGDLFDARPGLASLATPNTILCRCEDVTAGAVDSAVAAGATTMAALKVVTRCGQGPCQGRTCERLVASRLPEPERFSARAPMRPIPLGVLMDVAVSDCLNCEQSAAVASSAPAAGGRLVAGGRA